MPLSSIGNINPYKKLYGTPPPTTHLKAFSCLCFISTIKQGRKKFDPKADPCIFLGYPFAQQAYRVYNMKTKKVLITRDITFYENLFPYHLDPKHLKTPLPFYLPTHHPLLTADITPTTSYLFPYSTTPTPTPNVSHTSTHPASPCVPSSTSILPTPTPTNTPNSYLTPTPPPYSSVPRRTTRPTKPPSYLQQYVFNLATTTPTHSSSFLEPSIYKLASKDPCWVCAMELELDALSANSTWDLVPLPPSKKAIGPNGYIKLNSGQMVL